MPLVIPYSLLLYSGPGRINNNMIYIMKRMKEGGYSIRIGVMIMGTIIIIITMEGGICSVPTKTITWTTIWTTIFLATITTTRITIIITTTNTTSNQQPQYTCNNPSYNNKTLTPILILTNYSPPTTTTNNNYSSHSNNPHSTSTQQPTNPSYKKAQTVDQRYSATLITTSIIITTSMKTSYTHVYWSSHNRNKNLTLLNKGIRKLSHSNLLSPSINISIVLSSCIINGLINIIASIMLKRLILTPLRKTNFRSMPPCS